MSLRVLSPASARACLRTASHPTARAASSTPSAAVRVRKGAVKALLVVSAGFGVVYLRDPQCAAHEYVVMPVIRSLLDAEESHRFAICALQWPIRPKDTRVDDASLQTHLLGLDISNPIGLAAGFDKNAEAIDGLFDLGFGYVEIGSVTPEPQPGNPKPRFFRLLEDGAAINRYGFNSDGHASVLDNLRLRILNFATSHPSFFPPTFSPSTDPGSILPPPGLPRSLVPGRVLAINLGKNKTSPETSDEDYLVGVRTFGPYADVLVINVSSPNTPGLRLLQGGSRLGALLGSVVKERDGLAASNDGRRPSVLVKVAPDLDGDELKDVAQAVRDSGVDGVIVSNTTISRPSHLKSPLANEVGGLSGPPVKPFALSALRSLRDLLPASTPLIGCGGISNGADALEFAEAGASAVQMYTSFGYAGVGLPSRIKEEVTEELLRRGGKTWSDVVSKKGLVERVEEKGLDLVAQAKAALSK